MVKISSNFSKDMFYITPDYGNELHWKCIEKQNWENAMQFCSQRLHENSLMYSPCGTDIVFSCQNGIKAFAHRMVLNSVPFLKNILDDENIQDAFGQTVVVLPDFEAVSVIACLSWIYNRKIVEDKNEDTFAKNLMTLNKIFGIEIEASLLNVDAQGTENFETIAVIDSAESTEMYIDQELIIENTFKSPSNTETESTYCAIQSDATSVSPAKTCIENDLMIPQESIESNEHTMSSNNSAQMLSCIEFEQIYDSTLPNMEQPGIDKSGQYENDQEKTPDTVHDRSLSIKDKNSSIIYDTVFETSKQEVPQDRIDTSREFSFNSNTSPETLQCKEPEHLDDSNLQNIEVCTKKVPEQFQNALAKASIKSHDESLSNETKNSDMLFDKATETPEHNQAKKDASMIIQKISKAGAVQLPIANMRLLEKSKQKICKSIKSALIEKSPIQVKNNSKISPEKMIKRHSFPNATTIKPRRLSMRINNRETKGLDDGLSQKSIIISSNKQRNKTAITSPKIQTKKNKSSKTPLRSSSKVFNAPETKPCDSRVSSIGSLSLTLPEESPSRSISTELKDIEFAHVCPECKVPLRKNLFWRHFMGEHRGKSIDLKSIKRVPIVDIEQAPIVDKEQDNNAVIRELIATGKLSDL